MRSSLINVEKSKNTGLTCMEVAASPNCTWNVPGSSPHTAVPSMVPPSSVFTGTMGMRRLRDVARWIEVRIRLAYRQCTVTGPANSPARVAYPVSSVTAVATGSSLPPMYRVAPSTGKSVEASTTSAVRVPGGMTVRSTASESTPP